MLKSVQECNKPEIADRSRYRIRAPFLGLVGVSFPYLITALVYIEKIKRAELSCALILIFNFVYLSLALILMQCKPPFFVAFLVEDSRTHRVN